MSERGVRFIRKHGRIIPIRSKKSVPFLKSSETKIDVAAGATGGLTASLFFKRKKFIGKVGLISLGVGVGTTLSRFSKRKKNKGWVARDIGGGLLKTASAVSGGVVGTLALVGLHKLKLRKFVKPSRNTIRKVKGFLQ